MTVLRLLILPPESGVRPELIEADGDVVSRRPVDIDEWLDVAAVLVAPGADTVARWMDLPVGSPAQARSAAAFRIEDEVALGGEDLHIAVGGLDDAGRTLVVWTARAKLKAWLDTASAHGVSPEAVIPDYLLLPEDGAGQLVVAPFGERLGLREPGRAFNVEPDLAALLAEDRPHRYIPAAELDPLLVAGARSPAINLLQGQFAIRRGPPAQGRKRLAILAAVAVISPLILFLAQIAHDQLTARALERQARSLAVSMVPQASRYEDPAAFALARFTAAQGRQGFGDLAASYLTMVRSAPGVTLDTLVYGEDGAIRSAIAYANYSDMDQLRDAARKAGLQLTEQSTVTEGARITSDLIVRRQP